MGSCCGYLNNSAPSEPVALPKESLSEKILCVIESEGDSIEKPAQQQDPSPPGNIVVKEGKEKKAVFWHDSPKSLNLKHERKEETFAIGFGKSYTYRQELEIGHIKEESEEKADSNRKARIKDLDEGLRRKVELLIKHEDLKRNPSVFNKSRSFLDAVESIQESHSGSEDEVEQNRELNKEELLAIQKIVEKREDANETIERKSPTKSIREKSDPCISVAVILDDQKAKPVPNSKEKDSTTNLTNTTGNQPVPINESLKTSQLPDSINNEQTTSLSTKNPQNTTTYTATTEEKKLPFMPRFDLKPRKSLLKCRSIGRHEKSSGKKKRVKFEFDPKKKR